MARVAQKPPCSLARSRVAPGIVRDHAYLRIRQCRRRRWREERFLSFRRVVIFVDARERAIAREGSLKKANV